MDKKIFELKSEILRLKKMSENQEKEIEKLKSLADYDFLTGLYNRQGFLREAERFVDLLKDSEKFFKGGRERRKFAIRNFSIIFIDLDNLKKLNDRYGHKAGDKYIKISADIFKKTLRDIDIVGRWGGDEFVVGLIDTDINEAEAVAKKIKTALSRAKLKGMPGIKPSASFGVIAAKNQEGKIIADMIKLLEKSDKAMYLAKKKEGKGAIVIFR
ncbi:MAG: GGDEF domain-containing protein [Candidatus Wolfebacteria bacterium]|nr:GGDEF domain-containing protein [Candidatus Wolfebacteria bacterium]